MFEREEQLHLHQFGTLTDVEAELNQIRGESWNVERAHNEKQKQQAKAEKSARRMNKKKRGTSLNTPFFSINFSLTLVTKGAEGGESGKRTYKNSRELT